MPIKVTCSNCGGVLHAPDDAGGKRGRCPTCGNILPIPASATQSSVGALPDPPVAKGRAPSFGDFAVGPGVGAPPGGPPESIPIGQVTSPMPSPAARAASVPMIGDPRPDPRKASVLPPPPPAVSEPRRAADPFARKGTGGADWQAASSAVTPGMVKAWRRAKSGLWWVGLAAFLFLVPAVVLPGMAIAEHFTKKPLLPDDNLAPFNLPQSTVIPLLVAVGAVLLGLICLFIGRLGFSNVPARSCAKGPALLSVLATILVLAGALGVVFPSVAFLFTKPEAPAGPNSPPESVPLQFMPPNDPPGMIQRYGALAGIAALLVGEFWFASAVGRVGSALTHKPTAARATRYSLLLGLTVILTVGLVGVAATDFGFGAKAAEMSKESGAEIKSLWAQHVTPLFDKLGEFRPLLTPGLILLGGLFLGLVYCRLVSAPRRAIREWLEANAGV